jgi:hypothetical protein
LNKKRRKMITQISLHDLTHSRLAPNKVIVKPDFKQNYIGGNAKIQVDSRFSQEMHAPTTGIIINQCTTLDRKSMDWITTIETKKGDNVIYSYESALFCMDEEFKGRMFCDENQQLYFMLDYEDMFCVINPDNIIPINGLILVSAINEEYNSALNLAGVQSCRYGIVEYVGSKVESYQRYGLPTSTYVEPKEEIKIGSVIAFSTYSDIPLEYEAHKQTAKTLFRMHRCDVDAILC